MKAIYIKFCRLDSSRVSLSFSLSNPASVKGIGGFIFEKLLDKTMAAAMKQVEEEEKKAGTWPKDFEVGYKPRLHFVGKVAADKVAQMFGNPQKFFDDALGEDAETAKLIRLFVIVKKDDLFWLEAKAKEIHHFERLPELAIKKTVLELGSGSRS